MFAKLLVTTGLVAGAVVLGAPAAHATETTDVNSATGCVTQLVAYVRSYGHSYTLPNNWVTVSGVDISINGSNVLADTSWNLFVTEDYAAYLAAGGVNFVNCVV